MQAVRLDSVLLVCVVLSACGFQDRKQFHIGQYTSKEFQEEQLVDEQIDSEIVTRDANGDVESVKGLEYSSEIENNKNLRDREDLSDLFKSEKNVFEFAPPDGFEAEFSKPVMVSGASLALKQVSSQCPTLEYQKEELRSKIFSQPQLKKACVEKLGTNTALN